MECLKKEIIIKAFQISLILLFFLLIFKDPFSERTLIPNFEPYPDTFYYINPALGLVKGTGFNIGREGRFFYPNVGPLYSLSLTPLFFIKSDPRMTYYTNVFFAFISLFLFQMILKKIIENDFVILLILFLYITNFFIYWVPTIAMAENLTLTLFLAAIFFLLSKTTKINSLILIILAIGSYATKYANIPITLTIILLLFGKIIFGPTIFSQKIKQILFLLVSLSIIFSIFGIFEIITRNSNIFYQIFFYLIHIYNSIFQNNVNSTNTESKVVYTSSWFGVEYIGKNLPLYLKSITGSPNKFLWDNTPLIPVMLSIPSIAGILIAFFRKKFRFISIMLVAFISSLMIFMSTFYSFDARYIYIAIPSLLIGLGLFIMNVAKITNIQKKVINVALFIFIFIYLINIFTRIKSQISLNFKHAETPWNYIAVLKMNEYFTADKVINSRKPILISALSPFLIDYYTNRNYSLLPLSYDQEFRGQKAREIVWGPNDYSDLIKLYTKYLNEKYDVYVSRAGLGNEEYTNRDFNNIVKEFNTQLVQQGCYDQCNIYSVKLKEKNDK